MSDARPPVLSTSHRLPFRELAPGRFEDLCVRLLDLEGYDVLAHDGAKGDDRGVDVFAARDGQRIAVQCKRMDAFYPRDAEEAVLKILSWPETERPSRILLIVSSDVSRDARDRAQEKAGSLPVDLWAGEVLEAKIRRHGDLLGEFFQMPGGRTEIHYHDPGKGTSERPPTARFLGAAALLIALVVAGLLTWWREPETPYLWVVVEDFSVTGNDPAGNVAADEVRQTIQSRLTFLPSTPPVRVFCHDCPQVTDEIRARYPIDYTLRRGRLDLRRPFLRADLYGDDFAYVDTLEANGGQDSLAALAGELVERLVAKMEERKDVRLDPSKLHSPREDQILALNRHGIELSQAGNHKAAQAALRQALSLDPTSAASLANLAFVLEEDGQYQEALAARRKAAELRPEDPIFLFGLGHLLLHAPQEKGVRNLPQAVEVLERAVARDPGYVQARNELGNAYLLLNRPGKARAMLEQAAFFNPREPAVRKNLGRVALAEAKPREAAGHFEKALSLYPEDDLRSMEAAYLQAKSWNEAGEPVRACKALRIAYKLDVNRITPWVDDIEELSQELTVPCRLEPA